MRIKLYNEYNILGEDDECQMRVGSIKKYEMMKIIFFLVLVAVWFSLDAQTDSSLANLFKMPIYRYEFDDNDSMLFNVFTLGYEKIKNDNIRRLQLVNQDKIGKVIQTFKNLEELNMRPSEVINLEGIRTTKLRSFSLNFQNDVKRQILEFRAYDLKTLNINYLPTKLEYFSLNNYSLSIDRLFTNSSIKILDISNNKELDFLPITISTSIQHLFIDKVFDETPELCLLQYLNKEMQTVVVLDSFAILCPYTRSCLLNKFNSQMSFIFPNDSSRGSGEFMRHFKPSSFSTYNVRHDIDSQNIIIQDNEGRVRLKAGFVNSKLNGKLIVYNENGSIKEERIYKENLPIGVWRKYDTKNRLITTVEFCQEIIYKYYYYIKDEINAYQVITFTENKNESLKILQE